MDRLRLARFGNMDDSGQESNTYHGRKRLLLIISSNSAHNCLHRLGSLKTKEKAYNQATDFAQRSVASLASHPR
jgi:hypothetical protein